ncbi:NaeI family type II restriction endonuclease [Corynebacterium xerosis]|uniref:NaeI family type II restriction endonuclease n=1 Tax=Corynebacterium xerosis TaxID=1725 RepID=UPI003879DF02
MSITFASGDPALARVRELVLSADPDGSRFAQTFRSSYDRLYNGQWTGRYSWDQLYKTEKTHFGTLIEIAIRQEFDDIIDDGVQDHLDYRISGVDVDCKFSMGKAQWMIPMECVGEIIIGLHASDEKSTWSLCVERATEDKLTQGGNRDRKRTFTKAAKADIQWLFDDAPLPVNRLLHLPEADRAAIFEPRSGQQRVCELFRRTIGLSVNRESIAAVAEQKDYMKRVRGNGGARGLLQPEGIVVLSGKYRNQASIAEQLVGAQLMPEELMALKLAPAASGDGEPSVQIGGGWWRVAHPGEAVRPAPVVGEAT